ncbi:cysteine hydrolase [Aquabacterium sp.]|uniref:cysteine hydrolase family protein n=1 Tax=Aquabacterium sp. TaxID=1872578 RepID=UPI0025B990E2|nr:cysteine hydrolase [Aquabacterium sp.]
MSPLAHMPKPQAAQPHAAQLCEGWVPAHSALVVIDMQRDFCEPGGYAAQAGLDVARLAQPMAHIHQLLQAARAAGWLVVHTREGHRPDLSDCPPTKMARSIAAGAPIGSPGPLGRLLVRGEPGHDTVPLLYPEPGEIMVDKPGYSAFHQTDLSQILSNRRVQHLLLCGVTTEVCVQSTLRDAVDRGFDCVTVGDACAASDPALQAPALAMIAVEGGIFGRVATTAELLSGVLRTGERPPD